MSTNKRESRFAPYKAALQSISTRTKTPLPSLIFSFAVLHEITAIAPLVSVFLFAKTLGVGERAIKFVRTEVSDGGDSPSWVRDKGVQWLDEGEKWAGRVGRRYGVFGYAKVPRGENNVQDEPIISHTVAADVANAVLAYGVTKALLPARIGLSLYFSPAFSRHIVEPMRSRVMGRWRR